MRTVRHRYSLREMPPNSLPDSSSELVTASWDDLQPHYEELATRPLEDMAGWLRDWSALERLITEAATLAGIAYSADTRDAARERLHLRWATDIQPRRREESDRLARRLLGTGEVPVGLETTVRRFGNQVELFRAENLPHQAELSRLNAAYEKLTGGMTVEWAGKRLTLPQVAARLGDVDRGARAHAFRLTLEPYIEHRSALVEVFDRMYGLRQQTAANAGFANYRDYAHREKNRFDYSPEDCLRWDEAVREAIVPAAHRVLDRRRRRMGVDSLRPWDVQADPLGRPQLKPFQSVAELCRTAGHIFTRIDPALGEHFGVMVREGLLDLESRPGKAPGGYCAALPHRGRAFIFMNAVGVDADVRTLLHEAGHAFHNFERNPLPLFWQQAVGSEAAEFASMTMELLGLPFLAAARGGFYGEEETRRARASYLEGVLLLFGHIASVDAFQQWLYTSPEGADAGARDARWLELRAAFETGLDWSGLEQYRTARWYAQQHIYQVPFYYIEYGIARLAALQVWRDSLTAPAEAVRRFRRALALGGSRPLPEVYAAAGARLIFDAAEMCELVELVEAELEKVEE
jgi:oligoendopeptidase F